jgi:uncharacterized membrane protein HdeD (DUF308 family)
MYDKIKSTLTGVSVVYLILGIIMFIFPDSISDIICYVVGLMFLFLGIAGIVMYVKTELKTSYTSFTLIMSILFGAFGIFIISNPKIFASFIPLVIGIFLIVDAISKLSSAFDLKSSDYQKWWEILIVAFIVLGCGLFLVFKPFTAVALSIRIIGIILIVDAISNAFTIYSYSQIKK